MDINKDKPIIEFKNFNFQYQSLDTPTLKNINIFINKGEKVLIAGPSGSGKSTLGHCLNGLIPFSYKGSISGELTINGISPKDSSIFETSKYLSTILQDQDGQFIGLSVGEDVAFRDENQNVLVKDMIKNVGTALNRVKMEKYIDSSPQELSGGLKQKASLAGILMSKTPVLLFDEPLANLDPASGREAMRLISEVHKKSHKTTIVIEHRIEDVLAEDFDRIILIDKGTIVASGTPRKLIQDSSLKNIGLREPLYIEALRYANINLLDLEDPLNIESLNTPDIKEKINKWIKGIDKKQINYSDKILEVKDLSFSYSNKVSLLKNINFDLYQGEIISLLGNNGAGKSTLSKVITGICKNQFGSIFYKGEDIKNWSIRKRGEKIGYVMQNPNHMITQDTVFEEAAFGLKLRNVPNKDIQKKVGDSLKICGLFKLRNWPISALSYGQKKRLTIASILALDPNILILDEPTAGQDYRHYLEFMRFIKELTRSGISIIFITHDMHLALEYSNRAVVLSDGKVVQSDSVINILSNHNTLKTANLKKTSISTLANTLDLDEKTMLDIFINCEEKEVM